MMALDQDSDGGDITDPIVTMVCHQAVGNNTDQDTLRPSSMVCHSIGATTIVCDDKDSDSDSDEEDYECEDEEGSAVTYSFTLGNNVPLVVQTVTSEVVSDKNEENEADNKNDITIITNDEADDIVAEPMTSKFIVNFRKDSEEPEEHLPSIGDSSLTNTKEEQSKDFQNVEATFEKPSASSTKTKILNVLFGCFRRKRNKCKD